MEAVDAVQALRASLAGKPAGEEEIHYRVGDSVVFVAVNLRAKKLEGDRFNTDLLSDFAAQALLSGFIVVNEAARQPEFAPGRLMGTAEEQEFADRVAQESGAGNGWVEEQHVLAVGTPEYRLRGWLGNRLTALRAMVEMRVRQIHQVPSVT